MNLESRLNWSALLLRCTTGALFLAHGFYLKLFVFGMDGTVGFFQSLGYPAALAYFVVAAETLGGLALILGIFTRWVSLGLIPILAGAALVHLENGWLFNAPDGGWEYPVFWVVVMLVLAVLGDGRYSLSSLLTNRDADGQTSEASR